MRTSRTDAPPAVSSAAVRWWVPGRGSSTSSSSTATAVASGMPTQIFSVVAAAFEHEDVLVAGAADVGDLHLRRHLELLP